MYIFVTAMTLWLYYGKEAYGQEDNQTKYDLVNDLIKTGKFTEQEAKEFIGATDLNMTGHRTNNTDKDKNKNEPWIKIPFEIEANITFDIK
jgi:polyhydroxyalkanoate synthesis regulator phasin